MVDKELSQEEQFRSALQDVVAIGEKLSPYCKSVEELTGMVELALLNDAQLRLLMELVSKGKK